MKFISQAVIVKRHFKSKPKSGISNVDFSVCKLALEFQLILLSPEGPAEFAA